MEKSSKIQIGYTVNVETKNKFDIKCKRLKQNSSNVIETLMLYFLQMNNQDYFKMLLDTLPKTKNNNK